MKFANGNDNTGLDERGEIDVVSAWLLKLAIGMMVFGLLFAVLDQYHFFHESSEQPQVHHVAAAA
jgi:hypothetical protein